MFCLRDVELEATVALKALGVSSIDSSALVGLVGSSPRSLGLGVGVGASESPKGSERGSIAPRLLQSL